MDAHACLFVSLLLFQFSCTAVCAFVFFLLGKKKGREQGFGEGMMCGMSGGIALAAKLYVEKGIKPTEISVGEGEEPKGEQVKPSEEPKKD